MYTRTLHITDQSTDRLVVTKRFNLLYVLIELSGDYQLAPSRASFDRSKPSDERLHQASRAIVLEDGAATPTNDVRVL